MSSCYQYSPVLRVCGEKVSLYERKGGNSIAKYVSTPHQGDPVVKDDGGRKPVEKVGIGIPQSMSDEPTLQPVDLVLVNEAYKSGWGHKMILLQSSEFPSSTGTECRCYTGSLKQWLWTDELGCVCVLITSRG